MLPENEENSATGNRQSDFAGTNPNRYGAPKPANEQDNPIQDEEAQNVTDGTRSLNDEGSETASNKANQGQ